MIIACIDVGYIEMESAPTTAIAACVVIDGWRDSTPASEHIVRISEVLNYQSGQFFRRELPCIEAVLTKIQ